MLEDYRGSKFGSIGAHSAATLPALSPGELVAPGPRAEHIQIVTPKDQHPFAFETKEMRFKIQNLDQLSFLKRCRVRLARPSEDAAIGST